MGERGPEKGPECGEVSDQLAELGKKKLHSGEGGTILHAATERHEPLWGRSTKSQHTTRRKGTEKRNPMD